MYEKEIKILSRISLDELRSFVGEDISTSVSEVFNTNVERQLAELVILKFGDSVLDEKKIRSAIFDLAPIEKLKSLGDILEIHDDSDVILLDKIVKHFKSYNFNKSKILVDWLGLPPNYYKKVKIDDRHSVEKIKVDFNECLVSKGYLHYYQKGVKDKIMNLLDRPGSRAMVQMPTGSGKTYTALETVVDVLRRPFNKNFCIWLVNTNELAEQALISFQHLWKLKGDRELTSIRIWDKFFPDKDDLNDGGIVFITYELMGSVLKNTSKRKEVISYIAGKTDYVIVDEAHSSVAETYERCIRFFLDANEPFLIGLSATPHRDDHDEDNNLKNLYRGKILSISNKSDVTNNPIIELQKGGYLANVKTEILHSEFVSAQKKESTILKELSLDGKRNQLIIGAIQRGIEAGDKCIVFACTLSHVLALKILCDRDNISSEIIVGKTHQSVRNKIINDFNEGKFNVLINLEILSTGIDIPSVNRLIITRPIKSQILYSQVVGRALRGPKNGGNEKNTIINLKDNLDYFGSVNQVYKRFAEDWNNE